MACCPTPAPVVCDAYWIGVLDVSTFTYGCVPLKPAAAAVGQVARYWVCPVVSTRRTMNWVDSPGGTGWKALRSSKLDAGVPRPVAAMRYIAAEADESRICVQPPPAVGMTIC